MPRTDPAETGQADRRDIAMDMGESVSAGAAQAASDPAGATGLPRALPPGDERAARLWNDVGADWVSEGRQALWRRHNDRVASQLLARWLPEGIRAALKTDLFDEAISPGLYPAIAARAGAVHGIDIAEETAEAALRRHPGMAVQVADVRALPYPDGAFDAVVSLSTLDHFERREDIARALAELWRVTAPRGRLVLTLDNLSNPKIALRQALPEEFLRRTGLVPYFCGVSLGPRALSRAVEAAGFRVVERTAILHAPRVLAVRACETLARIDRPGAERRLLSALAAFERLERAPTRWLTGHFTAILAERAD